MKKHWLLVTMIVVVISLLTVKGVSADGIIIPDPCDMDGCPIIINPMEQLVIKYHHVEVAIVNQIATTHVDQVFYNPNDYAIEGIYIFPIPVDATVTNFVLWIDGEPVEGEVMDAVKAKEKYEEIVYRMQDPALLEYIGRGAVQARVFPIQPKDERRIELEYRQVLTADNNLVRYEYPLNTEKFSALPIESVSVKVEVDSTELESQPIRAIYSPSHTISINKADNYHFTASYEENNVLPDQDFSLYYSIGETEAFHLFTYRDPDDEKDPDGFFMLLLAPKPGDTSDVVEKDVILVLDRSGSMEGDKFKQAQSAARYILSHLQSGDRFHLITFSDSIMKYEDGLSDIKKTKDAIEWIDNQVAAGSTDINRSLLEAMAVVDKNKPTYLIFMTDGLPTSGVVSSEKILKNLDETSPDNVRLFSFGVGYDVDTVLLDSLSQEHHGLSSYVTESESLDEILSGFYEKISTPVLTNLDLEFDGIKTYDIYPDPMPDLFYGSQVVVVGRYRDHGTADIILAGEVNGIQQEFTYSDQEFVKDSQSVDNTLTGLPRLWATRKIGYLLNKIRLDGADQETIDQIIYISIRYGIMTPYTSYLVTEPQALSIEEQQDLSEQVYSEALSAPTQSSGQSAVEKAEREGEMSQAEVPDALPQTADSRVKNVGSRTYILSDGVWIDTGYDVTNMTSIKVEFLSDDYFDLIGVRPEIGPVLALGNKVIFFIDGNAYEVVGEGEHTQPIKIPTPEPTEMSSEIVPTIENENTTEVLTSEPNRNPTQQSDDLIMVNRYQTSTKALLLGVTGGILVLAGVLLFLRVKKVL